MDPSIEVILEVKVSCWAFSKFSYKTLLNYLPSCLVDSMHYCNRPTFADSLRKNTSWFRHDLALHHVWIFGCKQDKTKKRVNSIFFCSAVLVHGGQHGPSSSLASSSLNPSSSSVLASPLANLSSCSEQTTQIKPQICPSTCDILLAGCPSSTPCIGPMYSL